MLEKATIIRPYAEAAFAYALEEKQLSDWSAMLKLLGMIVCDDSMQRVISSPKLSAEELYNFIIDICGDKLSQAAKIFVKILIDARRISLAAEISVIFEQKRSAAEGVSKHTSNKIDINIKENKDLIGGVIIRAGDSVVDASLRGRLKELNNIIAQ